MSAIRAETKPGRSARWIARAGNLFILFGVLLLLTVGALYTYRTVEEQRFTQESQQRREAFEAERVELEAQHQEEQARAEQERLSLLSAPLPQLGTSPPSTPTPIARIASPARRIIIPAIGVDSEVVESQIKNGEWLVPKFVVGHLEGTAQPGDSGNSVYSGHIQSISAGNVFERLDSLQIGDAVYIQTKSGQYLYEVKEKKVVANTDLSVVQPTKDTVVTLITCTGDWDFVRRDFLQRLVIVAQLFQDSAPGHLPVQPR